MSKEPARAGSGGGGTSGGEERTRQFLPRLTEVVPDFAELSPFFQRPNSAPPPDPTRVSISAATRELERQYSDFPAPSHPPESTLPPLVRGSQIRTHPGAGVRLAYHDPFEITLENPPSRPILLTERLSPSDRAPFPLRQTTTAEIPIRSPELPGRFSDHRPADRPRPSLYDPVHELPPSSTSSQAPPPPASPTASAPPAPPPPLPSAATTRRASRSHLPPIDVGRTVEAAPEAPQAPPYQPLPPIRSGASGGVHPPAITSPRYNPYPPERPYDPVLSRRRYSQTYARDIPRPPSPYRSPTIARGGYPPEAYAAYQSTYTRTVRRPSIEPTYYEERRPSLRHDSIRYPPPIPYGHSYPPSVPYEYGGARGYHDPYHGYLEYPPDRRLSQQEPGEQVTHLGVPERSYRPPMLGGTSPSSIRVQPPPIGAGIPSAAPGKRRGNLPKEAKDKLKQWLAHHVEHPYPTEEEKKELAAEAGMTMGQINNWFINARRRTLPRIPGTGRPTSPSTSRTLRRRPGDT